MQKIDVKKLQLPKIKIDVDAVSQIKLSLENDPYLANKFFRIHVSGKGCDGFSYQTIFDKINSDDLKIHVDGITIIMAPFTAYYSQNLEVKYIFDEQNEIEGFEVKNLDHHKFAGKFWREHPDRVPELS